MFTLTDPARALAIGEVVNNIWAGETFEFLDAAYQLLFGTIADGGGVRTEIRLTGRTIVPGQIVAGTARFPEQDKDILASPVGHPGERIIQSLSNESGAARTTDAVIWGMPI